jgi:hypothetical protein
MDAAAAAFFGPVASPLVGEVEFHVGEEEGAEFPFFGRGQFEVIPVEEALEITLGEVLGGFRSPTAAADVGVDGIPVELAELSEGLKGRIRLGLDFADQGPAGGREKIAGLVRVGFGDRVHEERAAWGGMGKKTNQRGRGSWKETASPSRRERVAAFLKLK